MKNKKTILALTLFGVLFTVGVPMGAQQSGKPPARIGWIWYGSAPAGALPSIETSIVDGLRELGYVEARP